VEKLERGNGGVWRYLYVDPKENLSGAFSGVCHEEKEPERIIRTFEFEELHYLFLAVAVAFLQVAGILGVNTVAFAILYKVIP
jgi:hypothetical protein